ncbi:hypothetical protein BG011_009134 [Mortierella polycephala]|uniref:Uncharacterized protein n=1 Tax=Mortierella polycephala TaxID=41804 RepID=A0A9P6TWE2_9FUNG|nr:hypothetical protein BG011_009134 [Mortierella polycephala]
MTKLLVGPPTPQVVNETTEAMCSLPACSQQTVTLVENTIDQNCVPGADPNKTMIVNNVLSLYTPAREGLCQKAANGTYCTTLLAQNLTNYVDANPPPSMGSNMTTVNQTEWANYFSNIPTDILCTDCNKAMLAPLDNFIAANQTSFSPTFLGWVDKARTEVKNKCGQDFLGNGTAPNNGTTPNQPASQGKEGENAGFVSVQTSLVLGFISSFVAVGAQFF